MPLPTGSPWPTARLHRPRPVPERTGQSSVLGQLRVACPHHACHPFLPADGGGSHQVVHLGEVDVHAVDGVGGGGEVGGDAREGGQIAAPFLDTHRLVSSPVHDGGRHR